MNPLSPRRTRPRMGRTRVEGPAPAHTQTGPGLSRYKLAMIRQHSRSGTKSGVTSDCPGSSALKQRSGIDAGKPPCAHVDGCSFADLTVKAVSALHRRCCVPIADGRDLFSGASIIEWFVLPLADRALLFRRRCLAAPGSAYDSQRHHGRHSCAIARTDSYLALGTVLLDNSRRSHLLGNSGVWSTDSTVHTA